MATRSNLARPNATITAERLRLGGFPQAMTLRPRVVGPLGPHGLPVNPDGQGATLSQPSKNSQGAQSGKPAPTGPAREIQRYKPPQSVPVMGHQAPATEPLRSMAAMNQSRYRPSSPPLTNDAQRILQNPDFAAAILSMACQTRHFNLEWVEHPTCGEWRSFSVRLGHHLVPSAGVFLGEKKAKGETALKAHTVVFDDMGVSRNAILRRYLASHPNAGWPAPTSTSSSGIGAANRDVAMTGTDRMYLDRPTLSSSSTTSGALLIHQSMSVCGGAPILNSANLASRTAQLRASSSLPSASQGLHRLATAPSGRASIDEGRNILESLGLVVPSAWNHTQPTEMSSAFLQGLAAGAQLSQIILQNPPKESSRSSRHYRERDRQPRRERRSRSPRRDRRSASLPTERQSAAAARRSRDPSMKLENDESRPGHHSPPPREARVSTDRYRPNYDLKMTEAPEVAIKKEASTEVGSLLGATPGVSASSSGTESRRRSSAASTRRGPSSRKPMPENEKWDHDGFAQRYPSGPMPEKQKWDHDGFSQHYPSGPKM